MMSRATSGNRARVEIAARPKANPLSRTFSMFGDIAT
jgi:hypothetical protein